MATNEQQTTIDGLISPAWPDTVQATDIEVSERRSRPDITGLEIDVLAGATLPVSVEVLPPVATSRIIRRSEERAIRFGVTAARAVQGEQIYQAARDVSVATIDLTKAVRAATLAERLRTSKLRESNWLIPTAAIKINV